MKKEKIQYLPTSHVVLRMPIMPYSILNNVLFSDEKFERMITETLLEMRYLYLLQTWHVNLTAILVVK